MAGFHSNACDIRSGQAGDHYLGGGYTFKAVRRPGVQYCGLCRAYDQVCGDGYGAGENTLSFGKGFISGDQWEAGASMA